MVAFVSTTPVELFVHRHAVTTSLMKEIRRHGPAIVAQNRMFRANLFGRAGNLEAAERLEQEGDVALSLVPVFAE